MRPQPLDFRTRTRAGSAAALLLPLLLGACDGGSDAGSPDGGNDPDGGSATMDAGSTPSDGGPGGTDADAGSTPSDGWSPLPWEDCEGGGETVQAGPDDYRQALSNLEPGDTLQLEPGMYERGIPVRVSGEPGRCIVIEGMPGEERPVILGSNSFNLIAFHGVSWVKVRHLAVDGLGMAGFGVASQGGHESADHHIVVEDIMMEGLGGNQQIVGVSTKSTCWDWVIRGNRIEGAGTGMYLGNSNGMSPFIRGVIEFNVVLDTIGYNAQIKHQNSRPSLEGMPTDPTRTVIRYNVFSKESGGATDSARPNLLLGHFPEDGTGSDDHYFVYGNFFYENPTENLVQAEGNVAFYNNVLINHEGWGGVTFQPHNGSVRDIDVFFNTVLATGRPINISGGADGYEQHIRSNAVFSEESIRGGMQMGNFQGSVSEANSMLVAPEMRAGNGLDMHPMEGMLEQQTDSSYLEAFPQALLDFDRRAREGDTAGAYAGPPTDTSWPLARDGRPYGN